MHLLARLCPRLSSIQHDDVAEFAIERAAARELERHRIVIVEPDEPPLRHRRPAHIWEAARAIYRFGLSRLKTGAQVTDHVLGLAEHDVIHARDLVVMVIE